MEIDITKSILVDIIFRLDAVEYEDNIGYTGLLNSYDGLVTLYVQGNTLFDLHEDVAQALHVYYSHPSRIHKL